MTRIERLFASFGDDDQFLSLLAQDVRLIGVREESYKELPLYGTFIGHDGARHFLAGLRKAFEPRQFLIDAVLEDERQGLATGRFEHRLRENDAHLKSFWAVHCRFRGDLVTHYRFEDTAATEEAFAVRTHSREEPFG